MNVVITGVNAGIGLAIAHAFLDEAATVILPVHSNGSNIEKLMSDYGSDRVFTYHLDQRDIGSIERFVSEVEKRFRYINVLVNNAGVSHPVPLEDLSADIWDKVIDTNLRGPVFLAQKVLPLLKKADGGSIVNISSMSGHEPYPGMGAYSTSKAALIMMTRQMAAEWAEYNIRVNTVSPGLIRTPLTESLYENEQIYQQRMKLVPLKRIGSSNEVADVVTFLSSSKAAYITGQSIIVDGGLLGTIQDHLAGRPASK